MTSYTLYKYTQLFKIGDKCFRKYLKTYNGGICRIKSILLCIPSLNNKSGVTQGVDFFIKLKPIKLFSVYNRLFTTAS